MPRFKLKIISSQWHEHHDLLPPRPTKPTKQIRKRSPSWQSRYTFKKVEFKPSRKFLIGNITLCNFIFSVECDKKFRWRSVGWLGCKRAVSVSVSNLNMFAPIQVEWLPNYIGSFETVGRPRSCPGLHQNNFQISDFPQHWFSYLIWNYIIFIWII